MSEFNRQSHWQKAYKEKGERQVSWFQEKPAISLELIHGVGAKPNSAIIDIGGGASRLVDVLVGDGYRDLTVLDLSDDTIAITRSRLAELAVLVKWIVADMTDSRPGSMICGTIVPRSISSLRRPTAPPTAIAWCRRSGRAGMPSSLLSPSMAPSGVAAYPSCDTMQRCYPPC